VVKVSFSTASRRPDAGDVLRMTGSKAAFEQGN
jgi:hypothetical protein